MSDFNALPNYHEAELPPCCGNCQHFTPEDDVYTIRSECVKHGIFGVLYEWVCDDHEQGKRNE